MDYRDGRHTVFQIEYHFVRVTKYRYQVPTGDVLERVRELVRETCEAFEWMTISKRNPTRTRRLGDAYPDFQSAT
jgi:REP element-mobilizing transposase RayT